MRKSVDRVRSKEKAISKNGKQPQDITAARQRMDQNTENVTLRQNGQNGTVQAK
jgi:hypothetical protein